jgi:hypothetical protein
MSNWPQIGRKAATLVLVVGVGLPATYLFLRAGMYPAWHLWCHFSQGDPVCNSFWSWVVSLK